MDWEHEQYQNSLCLEGLYLHEYEMIETLPNGMLEICRKCKDKRFFKDNNKEYLSYHLRSLLQPNHPRFSKEYGTYN